MAERPLTVLLCGYGAFGALHAAAWRRLRPDVVLLVAEPSAAARDRAVAEGAARENVAPSAAALMARADLVDIATPPETHLELARAALERGRPIILEKPAVRSPAEADRLAGAVAASGLVAQVQFVLRAHPLTRLAQDWLRAGAIGRLLGFESDFSGWKRMRADSSLIENDGVHFLDLMRFFAGAPARSADARGWRRLGGRAPDALAIEIGFADGLWGRLELGILRGGETDDPFVPGAATTKTFRLIGETGNLAIDFNRNRLFHGAVTYEVTPGGWGVSPGRMRWERVGAPGPADLLQESFRRFMTALEGRGTPLCDIGQGAVEMTRVTDALETALARPAPAPIAIKGASI